MLREHSLVRWFSDVISHLLIDYDYFCEFLSTFHKIKMTFVKIAFFTAFAAYEGHLMQWHKMVLKPTWCSPECLAMLNIIFEHPFVCLSPSPQLRSHHWSGCGLKQTSAHVKASLTTCPCCLWAVALQGCRLMANGTFDGSKRSKENEDFSCRAARKLSERWLMRPLVVLVSFFISCVNTHESLH